VADFETLLYDEVDGVAWLTLNRPEAHNAFNFTMQRELKRVWRSLRVNDDVRCIVWTGSGDKAFCVGIDRKQTMGKWEAPDDMYETSATGDPMSVRTPWHFDDPGENVGPKTNGLWKPVIAAVNGMACGGAFYMLGEVEFIVAADHATFFDPHVSYGMTSVFESIHMMQKMPFHEIMRLALLGKNERLGAERAREIGLVSEVVPYTRLHDRVGQLAQMIADSPPTAVEGTVRTLWLAKELSRSQALDMGRILIKLGSDANNLYDGEQRFRTRENSE
jgi:enoyl-CoA hydratase/carnithine racemase